MKIHYVPVLRCKQGEILALKQLKSTILEKVTPLFETIDDKYVKYIKENIKMAFVMTEYYRQLGIDPSNFIQTFFLGKIPPSINSLNKDVAVRVKVNSYLGGASEICEELKKLELKNFYLILDFNELQENFLLGYKILAETILNSLLLEDKIKDVIIVSSSSELDPTSLPKGLKKIKIYSKELFNPLKTSFPNLVYGDYTIFSNIKVSDSDTVNRPGAQKIRYTTDNYFLCLKGNQLKSGSEYANMSKIIYNSGEFSGKDFSAGDKFIYECAHRLTTKTGNLRSWVTNDINHHITKIVTAL